MIYKEIRELYSKAKQDPGHYDYGHIKNEYSKFFKIGSFVKNIKTSYTYKTHTEVIFKIIAIESTTDFIIKVISPEGKIYSFNLCHLELDLKSFRKLKLNRIIE